MAATAEAPAAEVAAPTTTTKQQQAPSSSSSKQAEEPVPVVSSLASVYPDGDFFFLKKETAFRFLPFGTGLARRLLFCFLWREHHPDVSYSMQRQKGAIKSAATPPPLLQALSIDSELFHPFVKFSSFMNAPRFTAYETIRDTDPAALPQMNPELPYGATPVIVALLPDGRGVLQGAADAYKSRLT